MQLDSGWAVEGETEGQAPTDERGQHVNIVPCRRRIGAASGTSAQHGAIAEGGGASLPSDAYGCGCGVAPAPLLNTGLCMCARAPA